MVRLSPANKMKPKMNPRTSSSLAQLRMAVIIQRIRRIPPGSVRAYSDIDPEAPRLVGRVLATTHQTLPWHRVIRADGTIPKGRRQRDLLVQESVPMRGNRVDITRARLPASSRQPPGTKSAVNGGRRK